MDKSGRGYASVCTVADVDRLLISAVPYPCGYVTISGKDWLTSR